MPVVPYLEHVPRLGDGVRLDPDAWVIGKVRLDAPATLGASAVIRGDRASIDIGSWFHLGARSTVHVDPGNETRVGTEVWVGDDAVIHGCVLGSGVRVEDGGLVLSRSVVGAGSILAADSLVPEGAVFPENSYIQGSPGRRQRDTTPAERADTRARVRTELTSRAESEG